MGTQIDIPTGSLTSTLIGLFEHGVRYSTVIDLGCADGHFFLVHNELGLFAGAVALNVDANAIFEESLSAIKETMGGDYFIGAINDRGGEVEFTMGAHPYWSSLRPEGDVYWQKINGLTAEKVRVPAMTLDALVAERELGPPYLLKLDIQGGELPALRGARNVLEDAAVVICEADMDDFAEINAFLVGAGFDLFDFTEAIWLSDRRLGWFYPVYVNRKLDAGKRKTFWNEKDNATQVRAQSERRLAILQHNAAILACIGKRRVDRK